MLRSQRKFLLVFLDFLLDPLFVPQVRRSDVQVHRHKITCEISRLERVPGYYIKEAVDSLRKEERLLVSERSYRTYQTPLMQRRSPKNLGNIEETERLFLAALIIRNLQPKSNPFVVLTEELRRRGNHRTILAVQMRIRRFETLLQKGEYFSREQIVEQQFLRFKLLMIRISPFGRRLATVLYAQTAGMKKEGQLLKPWSKHNLKRLHRLSQITVAEGNLLQHLCRQESSIGPNAK